MAKADIRPHARASRPAWTTPADASPPAASIAVCGETSAGKTIFLTCVFRTAKLAVSSELGATFDREYGGAAYFREIEERLIADGEISGTQEVTTVPARLIIKLRKAIPLFGKRLTVEIRDFAGRHFRDYADKRAAQAEGVEEKAREAYAIVDRTLERADVIIILIRSTELLPSPGANTGDPFTPSVVHLIERCESERTPVALLVSQADRTEALTDDVLRSFPRIQEFETKFTADVAESRAPSGRPFGIVHKVSCYTNDASGRPVRVTSDGRIWRVEPAQIVVELLRVALPRIQARLQAEAEAEAERKRGEAFDKAHRREAGAQKRRRAAASGFLGLFVAAAIALGVWQCRINLDNRRVAEQIRAVGDRVSRGDFSTLAAAAAPSPSPDGPAEALVLQEVTADSAEQPAEIVSALSTLQDDTVKGGQVLLARAALDEAHGQQLRAALAASRTAFEPNDRAWRSQIVPRLTHRRAIVDGWLHDRPEGASRQLAVLTAAQARARELEDAPFVAVLEREAAAVRASELVRWQTEMLLATNQSTVARLQSIRSKLPEIEREADSELRAVGLQFLAQKVAWSLLSEADNAVVEAALAARAPALGSLKGDKLRFDIVRNTITGCTSGPDCNQSADALGRVFAELDKRVAARQPLVESTLRDLLQSLTGEERRDVWAALIAQLEGDYLFSTHPESWPAGLSPLAARMRARLAGAGARAQDELILRLVALPIYEAELRYLMASARATAARYRLVETYGQALDGLSRARLTIDTNGLERMAAVLEEHDDRVLFVWDAVGLPTAALRAEVRRAASRFRSWRGPDPGLPVPDDDPLAAWLEQRLVEHCRYLSRPPGACTHGP